MPRSTAVRITVMPVCLSTAGPSPKLSPMQPSPMAETSRLLFPSLRFCIASPFQRWADERSEERKVAGTNQRTESEQEMFVATTAGKSRWNLLTQNLDEILRRRDFLFEHCSRINSTLT